MLLGPYRHRPRHRFASSKASTISVASATTTPPFNHLAEAQIRGAEANHDVIGQIQAP